jgi:hypothetical protein
VLKYASWLLSKRIQADCLYASQDPFLLLPDRRSSLFVFILCSSLSHARLPSDGHSRSCLGFLVLLGYLIIFVDSRGSLRFGVLTSRLNGSTRDKDRREQEGKTWVLPFVSWMRCRDIYRIGNRDERSLILKGMVHRVMQSACWPVSHDPMGRKLLFHVDTTLKLPVS